MPDLRIGQLDNLPFEEITPSAKFVLEQFGHAYHVNGKDYLEWLDGHGGLQKIEWVDRSPNGIDERYRFVFVDGTEQYYTVKNGNGIDRIEKVSESIDPETGINKDNYTVFYQDGRTWNYSVPQGPYAELKRTEVMYTVSPDSSVPPTTGWSTDIPEFVPDAHFLWTRTILYFEDDPCEPIYTVSRQGIDGNGFKSMDIYYVETDSSVDIPTDGWSKELPRSVTPGRFLWTKTVLNFAEGPLDPIYTISRQGIDGRGAVSSVNNVGPASNGNVTINANLIDTLAGTSVEEALKEFVIDVTITDDKPVFDLSLLPKLKTALNQKRTAVVRILSDESDISGNEGCIILPYVGYVTKKLEENGWTYGGHVFAGHAHGGDEYYVVTLSYNMESTFERRRTFDTESTLIDGRVSGIELNSRYEIKEYHGGYIDFHHPYKDKDGEIIKWDHSARLIDLENAFEVDVAKPDADGKEDYIRYRFDKSTKGSHEVSPKPYKVKFTTGVNSGVFVGQDGTGRDIFLNYSQVEGWYNYNIPFYAVLDNIYRMDFVGKSADGTLFVFKYLSSRYEYTATINSSNVVNIEKLEIRQADIYKPQNPYATFPTVAAVKAYTMCASENMNSVAGSNAVNAISHDGSYRVIWTHYTDETQTTASGWPFGYGVLLHLQYETIDGDARNAIQIVTETGGQNIYKRFKDSGGNWSDWAVWNPVAGLPANSGAGYIDLNSTNIGYFARCGEFLLKGSIKKLDAEENWWILKSYTSYINGSLYGYQRLYGVSFGKTFVRKIIYHNDAHYGFEEWVMIGATTLWRNPDDTQAFEPQDISLSQGIGYFDEIRIEFKPLSEWGSYTTVTVKPNSGTFDAGIVWGDESRMFVMHRRVQLKSTTTFNIQECKYVNVVGDNTYVRDNTKMIPHKVLGIKF